MRYGHLSISQVASKYLGDTVVDPDPQVGIRSTLDNESLHISASGSSASRDPYRITYHCCLIGGGALHLIGRRAPGRAGNEGIARHPQRVAARISQDSTPVYP